MIELANVVARLKTRLQTSLPGSDAQYLMAPQHRYNGNTPSGAKHAAVLLLLYQNKGKICIPFIKRTADKGPHSKQVSFPGGMVEPNDTSVKLTAIREFHEETGFMPSENNIIGQITELYIPVSNTLVFPFVGYSEITPVWKHHDVEVDRIIEMPIDLLLNNQFIKTEEWIINGNNLLVPFYHFDNEKIWGATAMMLSEFAEILKGTH